MITQRNFAAFLTNPSRVKKVNSLLEQFQLSDRIFKEQELNRIEELLEQEIDYSSFNERKEQVRQSSYDFLEKAIVGTKLEGK